MKIRSKFLAVLTAAGVLGAASSAFAGININISLGNEKFRPIAQLQQQRPPEPPKDINGQRPPMPPKMSRDMKGNPPEPPKGGKRPPMSRDKRPPMPPRSGDKRPPEMPRR